MASVPQDLPQDRDYELPARELRQGVLLLAIAGSSVGAIGALISYAMNVIG